MRRAPFLLLALLAGCSAFSGYQITFTTQDGATVDPSVDTLDFVISAPALAYISGVKCGDAPALELLPIINDNTEIQTAYNLPLTVIARQEPGTQCELTVMAFDQTTTSNARASISLVVAGEVSDEASDETSEEEETTEETPAEETPAEEMESIPLPEPESIEETSETPTAPEPVDETPAIDGTPATLPE